MIRLVNVSKTYNAGKKDELEVLKNVSVTFPDNGIIALCGRSGSGINGQSPSLEKARRTRPGAERKEDLLLRQGIEGDEETNRGDYGNPEHHLWLLPER